VTTLFSFVGTGRYESVRYSLDGRHVPSAEAFTQAAIVQLLAHRPERICLALTVKARSTNWPILEARLHELGYRSTDIKTIDIPDGNSEVELWDIFGKLVDIAEGPVVFDATHGFRALPLVATLALPFQGDRAGFHIERLLYGMYDSQNPQADTPIVDLSVMLDLPIWQQAVNDFKYHGRSRGLEARLRRPVNDLGRQLKHEAPRELVSLPKLLAKLSDHLSVNRIDDIPRIATEVVMRLREATSQIEAHPTARILKPLSTSVRELLEVVEPLESRPSEDPIEFHIRLALWYADREQFASALTTLREAVTDALVDLAMRLGLAEIMAEGKPYIPERAKYRMKIDGIFSQLAAGRPYHDEHNPHAVERIGTAIAHNPGLGESVESVQVMVEQRNKLNHGYKGQQQKDDASKMQRDKHGLLGLHADIRGFAEIVRSAIGVIRKAG